MKWILIGMLAESLLTSGHETREACEGRAVVLREQKAAVKCVEAPSPVNPFSTSGNNILVMPCPMGVCAAK